MALPSFALLAGLGIVGALAYVVTRKPPPGETPWERAPRFQGQLHNGTLYRVWLRVDTKFRDQLRAHPSESRTGQTTLSHAIDTSMRSTGFVPMLLTNDPTDDTIWTAIARWTLSSNEAFDTESVRYFLLQEVDPDTQGAGANAGASETSLSEAPPSLDQGLSPSEVDAVVYALGHDEDPKHLGGFAAALDPDFPVAAALLRLKERLASLRTYPKVPPPGVAGEQAPARPVSGWTEFKDSLSDLGDDVRSAWDRYDAVVGRHIVFVVKTPTAEEIAAAAASLRNPALTKALGRTKLTDALNRAMSTLTRDSRLLEIDSETLAGRLKTLPVVVRAAKLAMRPMQGGTAVIDPETKRRIDPTSSLFEQERPSPSAIQLAYATRRPELSLVASKKNLESKLKAIGRAASKGDPDGLLAKAALDRATRLIEMRGWVNWYERIQRATEDDGRAPGSLTAKLSLDEFPEGLSFYQDGPVQGTRETA